MSATTYITRPEAYRRRDVLCDRRDDLWQAGRDSEVDDLTKEIVQLVRVIDAHDARQDAGLADTPLVIRALPDAVDHEGDANG